MSQQARDAVKHCQQLTDDGLRMCLYALADRSGSVAGPFYTFPGQADIAEYCAKSIPTVERRIRRLADLGYITRARRQDGMGYFIHLSTEGRRLDPITHQHTDGSHPSSDVSEPSFSISEPSSDVSEPSFSDRFKGVEHKREQKGEHLEASSYQHAEGADRDSTERWQQLILRIEHRNELSDHLLASMRKASCELYRDSRYALIICRSSPDWFRAKFSPRIEQHLPAVTQLGGWRVIILSEGELRAIEREIAEENESATHAENDTELLQAQKS